MKNLVVFFSWTFLIFFFKSFNDYIHAQNKPFVVVLDAGHGGHDSGNRGNGYYEKI